jgi:hypothetical protein
MGVSGVGRTRRVRGLTVLWAGIAAVLIASVASAAPALPSPGTSPQIARLVAASVNIQTLTPTVSKKVANAYNDNPAVDYPQTKNFCLTLTACVFGNKKASKRLVIMGDSHAQMWIPALNRIGIALKMRVIVLYMARCPAASLDVWLASYDSSYTACGKQRAAWIAEINQLHPVTVLLADYTVGVYSAASGGSQLFTSAEWQTGMQTTITDLAPSSAKLAVLGDSVTFNIAPPLCLADYPNVQMCDSPNPNPSKPGQQIAERAAASADKVLYVDPTKWLCTSTACSPVVGNFIVYYDAFHLTCTYDAYLSGVLQAALKKVL